MHTPIAHLSEILIVAGLILLAIEILVLGFSTFVLFFLGLSAVLVGGLVWAGVLAPTLVTTLAALAIATVVLAAMLWKPLKRLQNNIHATVVTSDLVGTQFTMPCDVKQGEQVDYRYSGISWKVSANCDLQKGQQVRVIDLQVGHLVVTPVENKPEA